jgi:hypothetical protein
MQKAVGVGVDLSVALDAVHVEAHAVDCLYEDFIRLVEKDVALNKGL